MINKLEFLIAIAHEKHFGRAAEACGVTQPTLSAGIKQLEETLGVMLVRRGSRFLGFTNVQARHPEVRYTVFSRTSEEILELLANLRIDAGLTYIDNEPLGNVTAIALYQERYCLLTAADGDPFAERASVTWAEAATVPLCLLTRDMQNRRIIDRNLQKARSDITVMLESNSMIVLFSHIQSGRWSSIMPEKLTHIFGLSAKVRAIPIVDENEIYTVGLVAGPREPLTPLVAALMLEAKRVAAALAA